jgi:hypothetical protein
MASMNQDQLEELRKPTEIDYFLRKKLWILVNSAQNGAISEIHGVDVYKGVCSKQLFYNILKEPKRVAWLLTVPHTDQEMVEAALNIGLRNLMKFVSKEPTAETAGPFMKAVEFLYNRVHGPLVQTTRNLNVNVNKNQTIPSPQTPEDANKRLEEIKAKLVIEAPK